MLGLPPLAAEPIFSIGHFSVTNTYICSTLTMIGFVVIGFLVKRAVTAYNAKSRISTDDEARNNTDAPRGLLNFFEALLEFMLKYLDSVTGDRKKSIQFLPIIGALFLFIVVSNWIGLLPGMSSFGVHQIHNGVVELVPLFRSANTDLNLTLSMAVLIVVSSHILGVASIGFFKHANKFIKLADLWHAVKTLKPMNIIIALVEFFVGLIEISSEVAKMISLSLRLFGNVFAGEVLLTAMASLLAYILPLPFMALELLVGLIQGMVFAMLALVYLTMAMAEPQEHGDSHAEEPRVEYQSQSN